MHAFKCQGYASYTRNTTAKHCRFSAQNPAARSTLLLRHTDSPSPPASSLRMLSPNPQAPVVPQTPVRTDLLQALQVLTQLAVHVVRQHLRVLAVHNVTLAIEEPGGNLVLSRVLDDGDDALEFFGGDFAGSGVAVRR